ncbi:uncharacterized protein EAF02_004770 [Botrytis sinoallii]|uniref:uncharacterized protein n=1 Tax=Botrytis sinoallii TaxID=1463999 RepID=UPI0018FF8FF6|nr:uncharacterized protein EAF02_004770 [Botrytis sinoallii]KAF7884434.1 hypothetical protein EAF02_004770 [Botrytis sinoallii]
MQNHTRNTFEAQKQSDQTYEKRLTFQTTRRAASSENFLGPIPWLYNLAPILQNTTYWRL